MTDIFEPRPNAELRARGHEAVRTSSAQVHVDSLLSQFAVAYQNSNFIADAASPPVFVEKLSGKYMKRTRKDVATVIDDQFGPRGRANEVTYDPTTGTYSLVDRGLYQPVPLDIESNADAPVDPRQWAVANVMQRIKLAREYRVATTMLTQANFAAGSYATASYPWTDETRGTPLSDLQTAIQALRASGAQVKKIGFCSTPVYHALAKHPQMMGLRPGGGATGGMLGQDEMAKFLGIDGIMVSDVELNSANQAQTASLDYLWTKTKFVLALIPDTVQASDLQVFAPSFMSKGGIQVRTWFDPSFGFGGAEMVQVEYRVDDSNVAMNDRAYLIQSVT